MTMTAVDYDDPSEGTNAKLIYSIEKNVIEEETGSPIFEIESDTGVIKTAVCCLDRERTPDYSIQVVAMDGGGLKGEEWKSDDTKQGGEKCLDLLFLDDDIPRLCTSRDGDGVYTSERHKRHASAIHEGGVVHRSGRDGRAGSAGNADSHGHCTR